MIYTLTLNPSIDYIINLEKFIPGNINLINSEYKLPGGKGINVSQVAKVPGLCNRRSLISIGIQISNMSITKVHSCFLLALSMVIPDI